MLFQQDNASRGERGNPTRKGNAAHIVSHELETLRFVSLLLPLCVSVPKLYSISREASFSSSFVSRAFESIVAFFLFLPSIDFKLISFHFIFQFV